MLDHVAIDCGTSKNVTVLLLARIQPLISFCILEDHKDSLANQHEKVPKITILLYTRVFSMIQSWIRLFFVHKKMWI